ncbi:uncharacterized protein BXZ73DRAFT_105351 [Epithele typhae]|uniref:uncharacterized protein n=1 Tax=Epithele typhae TaxID=378194 RepID=UPI0020075496|nr:uncharacterized protein BXZ73DRAFT_105351 [Epithele typhae]KAH9918225.1 hypothetical protein BXZ73DRAFT_105351 [Epithele typhae]
MLALLGAFRTTSRTRALALPAVVRQYATRALVLEDEDPIFELADKLVETADSLPEETSWERKPVVTTTPMIPRAAPGQFVTPIQYSLKYQSRRKPNSKPYRIGPGRDESRQRDIFHQSGLNPLREMGNTSLLSSFVNSMGMIQPRTQTHLTWKNQRRIGKAIRRAKMMGLIPMHSRRSLYPERHAAHQ